MVNKIILIGNLGQDPEIRRLESGQVLAKFSLATNESYADKTTGERVTQTEWHNCVVWGKRAEVIGKYVKKGSKLYVEGKQTHRQVENDGVTRYYSEVVVNDFKFMDSKGDNGTNSAPAAATATSNVGGESDLPF